MIFGYIGEASWILAKCYAAYRIAGMISTDRFNKWISASVWAVFSVLSAAYSLWVLNMTNLVGNYLPNGEICIVLVVLSLILFRSAPAPKIIGISILFEMNDTLDYFCQTILYCFLDTAGEGSPRMFQIVGMPRGILLCIYAAGLLMLGKRISYVYIKYVLPTWLATWKGMIIIFLMWFVNRFFQRVYYKSENLVTDTYFFVWLLVLFVIFVSVVLIWILQRRMRITAEETVQKVRYEAMRQEAEKAIDNDQKRRKLVHEIKGNIGILKKYLDEGDIVKARAFLNEVLPEDTGNHVYSWSGYQILDMIISLRVEEAKKAGIRCEVICDPIHELIFQDVEVCSLFGNLLTNAIEAQCGSLNQEKWIRLNIRQQKDTLYVDISNPFEHEIKYNNGKIQTSKKDTSLHGIGLSVIEQIVNKNDGEMDISADNQIFRVRIMVKSNEMKKKRT